MSFFQSFHPYHMVFISYSLSCLQKLVSGPLVGIVKIIPMSRMNPYVELYADTDKKKCHVDENITANELAHQQIHLHGN